MGFFHKDMLFQAGKIAIGAIASITIATILGLDYAISAGVVTILSIQPTKRETIKTATGRLLAFICALVISFFCFHLSGFSLVGFAVFILIYILVCQKFGWYSAMAVNSVLMSHFLTMGNMRPETVLNECLIFGIGVGMGILANLHLRKNVDYIEQLKEETDEQIRRILLRMSERILDRDISDYNGDCFVKLWESIRRAKNVAEENYNNQLRTDDNYDKEYIRMREKQCQVLYEMYKCVRQMNTTPVTAHIISEFLKEVSLEYHKTNTCEALMEQFEEIDRSMKSKPLPVEREEFEDRARLFYLLRHIEEFLQIKIDFAETHMKS